MTIKNLLQGVSNTINDINFDDQFKRTEFNIWYQHVIRNQNNLQGLQSGINRRISGLQTELATNPLVSQTTSPEYQDKKKLLDALQQLSTALQLETDKKKFIQEVAAYLAIKENEKIKQAARQQVNEEQKAVMEVEPGKEEKDLPEWWNRLGDSGTSINLPDHGSVNIKYTKSGKGYNFEGSVDDLKKLLNQINKDKVTDTLTSIHGKEGDKDSAKNTEALYKHAVTLGFKIGSVHTKDFDGEDNATLVQMNEICKLGKNIPAGDNYYSRLFQKICDERVKGNNLHYDLLSDRFLKDLSDNQIKKIITNIREGMANAKDENNDDDLNKYQRYLNIMRTNLNTAGKGSLCEVGVSNHQSWMGGENSTPSLQFN